MEIDTIKERLQDSIRTKTKLLNDKEVLTNIQKAVDLICESLKKGNKVLICGNGGSASDALHIAGELVGRFEIDRKGMAAIALNSDIATMTAISNDYGYNDVFSRQVEGIMKSGDILIGISTSGNSANVIKAFQTSHNLGGINILLSGRGGGKLRELSNCPIVVPSDITARIQESHMCIYHIICELIEKRFFGNE